MSCAKDYDAKKLPAPQPIKHKDANNIMREVRVYPFAGEFNNSLWFFFDLCLFPLMRCTSVLGMSWPDIFIEILNVLTKHPLQIMTQLISTKYSTHATQTHANFVLLIRDFISKLIQIPNPRDSLYHYLEANCQFNLRNNPTAHWSTTLFLRKCGMFMHGYSAIPTLKMTALWFFNSFPPGWKCSYVMHNPTETGLPDAERICNHMTIAQQVRTPTGDKNDSLHRLSNNRPLLDERRHDQHDRHRDYSPDQRDRRERRFVPAKKRRSSNPQRSSNYRRARHSFHEQPRHGPRQYYNKYDKSRYAGRGGGKPEGQRHKHKPGRSDKPAYKPNFQKPHSKPNGTDGHSKKPHFESHQLDQESVASVSMASAQSNSDHESQAFSMDQSSDASAELDNLQLDLDQIDNFDLMQLESVSETLEQECLELEAAGLSLNPTSIFAEDSKPASKPEPDEAVEDSKPAAKPEPGEIDEPIPRKERKSDS